MIFQVQVMSTVCLASLRPPNDGPIYTCSWCSYTCPKVPHLFSQPIQLKTAQPTPC